MNRRKFLSFAGLTGVAAFTPQVLAGNGADTVVFSLHGPGWTCHGSMARDTFFDQLQHEITSGRNSTITKLEVT